MIKYCKVSLNFGFQKVFLEKIHFKNYERYNEKKKKAKTLEEWLGRIIPGLKKSQEVCMTHEGNHK